MDIGEIARSYRQAKGPDRQIEILSDLTLKTIPEIKEILINKGVYKDMAITWTTEKEKQLRQMKKDGLPTTKIAEQLGGTDYAIKNKWQKLMAADKAKPNTASAPTPETLPPPVAKAPININVSKQPDEIDSDITLLNQELSALVGLVKLTHEHASSGPTNEYSERAGSKYNLLIDSLEKVVSKYERLAKDV